MPDEIVASDASAAAVPAAAPVAAVDGAVAPPAEAVEAPKETPKQTADAARFAALAKREKALQASRVELKAKESEYAALQEKVKSVDAARAAVSSNPLEALKLLGVTDIRALYESLTQQILNDGKPTADHATRALREEMDAFKREHGEAQKKAAEAEKAAILEQETAILDRFRSDTVDFVKSKPDDYEMIGLHDAYQDVVLLIERQFAATQRVMSAKEAADLVESELMARAEKVAASKKIAAKAAAAKAASEKQVVPAQRRTVSNDLAASTSSNKPALNEREAMQRALARLEASK
jgi:hypothetical protein